jgi:hypothetical protein
MESLAASTCTLCRYKWNQQNRNGRKRAVPTRGGPDEILKRSRPSREKRQPLFSLSFSSPETVTKRRYRPRREEKEYVRENPKAAAETGLGGGRPRLGPSDG